MMAPSGLRGAEKIGQEPGELLATHFAGGHSELAMANVPKAGDEPRDRYVVRRIGEHGVDHAPASKAPHQIVIPGVTAPQRVAAQLPDAAEFEDGWLIGGCEFVSGSLSTRSPD
jgi:hypothetical protein